MLSTTALRLKLCDYLAVSPRELPKMVGEGKCLVCASGHTLWDDLLEAGLTPNKWKQNFDVMAVNRAVMDLPCKVDTAYSNHIDMLEKWARARDVAYTQKDSGDIKLYSNREYRDYTQVPVPGNGTSTLNAAMTALMLGYTQIYICGAPLDNGPHYYDPPYFKWNHFSGPLFDERLKDKGIIEAANNNGIIRPWLKFLQRFKDNVIPLSGNPRLIYDAL